MEFHPTGPMVRELQRKSLVFKFANRYVNEHPKDSITTVTPAILAAFRAFLEKEKFDFQEDSEKHVGELHQIAERSHYNPDIMRDIEQLHEGIAEGKGTRLRAV